MNKRQKKKAKTIMAPVARKKRLNRFLYKISAKWPLSFRDFGDGYFVFNFGGNSVCHFGLKAIPDWTFGIWLTEKYPQFFGEHNDLIDKFKPSRCYVSKTSINDFILVLSKIIDNPDLYFVDSMTSGDAISPYKETKYDDDDDVYVSGYQVKYVYNEVDKTYSKERDESMTQEEYVRNRIAEHKERKLKEKEDNQFDYDLVFNFFRILPYLSDEIKAVYVKDKNIGGWTCNPRYDVDILLSDITEEQLCILDDKIIIIRNEVLDKKRTYDYNFNIRDYYAESEEKDPKSKVKREKESYTYKFTREPFNLNIETIIPKRGPNGEALLPREVFEDWD